MATVMIARIVIGLILTHSADKRVLPLSLGSFQGAFIVNIPAILASVVLSVLPRRPPPAQKGGTFGHLRAQSQQEPTPCGTLTGFHLRRMPLQRAMCFGLTHGGLLKATTDQRCAALRSTP
jgi:hypothetical protein